jgi:acyl carrier protein
MVWGMMAGTMVADKIRSALARELKRDLATIELHHSLREDLGLNSLDAIELMFKVEEEFDLEIPDADLQKLTTVGDLVSYLEGRLGLAPSPVAPKAPRKPVAVKAKKPAQAASATRKGTTAKRPSP